MPILGEWGLLGVWGASNSAPVLEIVPSATTIYVGQSVTLTANVTDEDVSDTHTYLWSSGETTKSITVTTTNLSQDVTIDRTCIANDGTINSNLASISLAISPVLASSWANTVNLGRIWFN